MIPEAATVNPAILITREDAEGNVFLRHQEIDFSPHPYAPAPEPEIPADFALGPQEVSLHQMNWKRVETCLNGFTAGIVCLATLYVGKLLFDAVVWAGEAVTAAQQEATELRWCDGCGCSHPAGDGWFVLWLVRGNGLVVQPFDQPKEAMLLFRDEVFACGEGSALVLVERFLATGGFARIEIPPAAAVMVERF